jgi:hypothetical protein
MQNNDNPVMQNMTGLSTLNLVSFLCATLNLVDEHAALGIDIGVIHVEFGTDSYIMHIDSDSRHRHAESGMPCGHVRAYHLQPGRLT